MLKKEITYVDFEGTERKEPFYFNLTKAEVLEWEMGISGGMVQFLEKIVAERDNVKIVAAFKELILKAYGEKSPDGRRFIKSEELATAFSQTGAYSELFIELATDEKAAADFVNGIVPQDMKR